MSLHFLIMKTNLEATDSNSILLETSWYLFFTQRQSYAREKQGALKQSKTAPVHAQAVSTDKTVRDEKELRVIDKGHFLSLLHKRKHTLPSYWSVVYLPKLRSL